MPKKKVKKKVEKEVKSRPVKIEGYITEDYFEMADLVKKGFTVVEEKQTIGGMSYTFKESKSKIEGGKANV